MSTALENLQADYKQNTYQTYPFLFEKIVHLRKADNLQVAKIYQRLTGKKITQPLPTQVARTKLTFRNFKRGMAQVDRVIGGNSIYQPTKLQDSFGTGKALTYQTAVKAYHQKLKADQLSRGFARQFSDYLGIAILLFSAFPIILYFSKASREHSEDVLAVRSYPTWRYLGSKYIVAVGTIYVLLLLLAIFPTVQIGSMGHFLNVTVDYWAFFRTVTLFILPTLMVIAALALVLLQVLKPIVTLAISLIFSFGTLVTTNINGYSTASPLIRFNIGENWSLYAQLRSAIYLNRFVYVVISIGLFGIAVYLRNRKRGWLK
ncbi:hypothetical protein ACLJJ6_01320 [Pediococcus siamensis]|uniref:hypothetical protein n=1 Tax=Pediococcus siamensis TaxID=381829 RepID=UPI0039A2F56B